MSQSYFFLNEKENVCNGFSNIEVYKCCDIPFPCLIKTGYKCLSCKIEYSQNKIYVYNCKDCNKVEQEVSIFLNLLKDNKTNWTSCEDCGKYTNYKEALKTIIIV